MLPLLIWRPFSSGTLMLKCIEATGTRRTSISI